MPYTIFSRKIFLKKMLRQRGLFAPSVYNIKTSVRTQSLRDYDLPILLVVLKQRRNHARKSKRRTVQSVCKLDLTLLSPIAKFQTICLIGFEIGN